MLVSETGKLMEERAAHPVNAWSLMAVTAECSLTVFSFLQLQNAIAGTFVIPAGMVTDGMFSHQ